jgi:LCP family protein required for cell wall assembly
MSSDRSPALAAALSLIFPGLGQIYAGAVRRGVLWAVPTLVLVLAAILVLAGGQNALLNLVSTDEKVLALVALNVAFFFYHVAAMFDAYGIAQRERRVAGVAASGAGGVALVVLVALALLIHAVPTNYALSVNDFLNRFLGSGKPGVITSPSFSLEPPGTFETDPPEETPTEPGDTPTPSQTPSGGPTDQPSGTPTGPTPPPTSFPPINTPWGERVNVLLIGSDAGPGRHGGRTDTMILLSVEINTGKAALFGFPRNMTNVPIEDAAGTLTFDRVWTDPFPPGNGDPNLSMLANLWQYAYDNAGQFYTPQESCPADVPNREQCLGDARAFRATTGAIQNLASVQIHEVIAVNLNAFRDLVDAVGGVWVDVPSAIYDDKYPTEDGVSPRIIDIWAGCQWFDGIYALAYARSRHADSDYQRMKRQQLVIGSVRKQLDPIALLPRTDELLNIASTNMWTTIARQNITLLAQVAARVDANRMYNVRIAPSRYPTNLSADEIRSIRSRIQNIFGEPQPEPSPRPSNKPASCPAPGQTPGPLPNERTPSPSPTKKATPKPSGFGDVPLTLATVAVLLPIRRRRPG